MKKVFLFLITTLFILPITIFAETTSPSMEQTISKFWFKELIGTEKYHIQSISFVDYIEIPECDNKLVFSPSENKYSDNIKGWGVLDTNTEKYDLYIGSENIIYFPEDSTELFAGFSELKSISFNNIDTSYTKTMAALFSGDVQLESLDLKLFDTSNVTDMSLMFQKCETLTSLDLSSFNTSNVINMDSMFASASSLTNLDLGSNFYTSSVQRMYGMFFGLSSLEYLSLGDKFDTSNVTTMADMFREDYNLKTLNFGNKFYTPLVTDMSGMFESDFSLSDLDISTFNTSNVINMKSMFKDMRLLENLNLGYDFDTSKVQDMSYMFYQTLSLKHLDLGNDFNTYHVSNMEGMFWNTGLVELDLHHYFDTQNVTNMSYMFSGTQGLDYLNLGYKFYTSNVIDMHSMFQSSSIKTLILGDWFNTSKVTDMSYMFSDMSNLEVIYVGNDFDITNVAKWDNMFSINSKLVGGNGTKYTDKYDSPLNYTNIDTKEKPGLFTKTLKFIEYKASDIYATYDGNYYGINLKVDSSNITIKYADADGNYILDEMPKYINAGEYVIKFELSGTGYYTVYDSAVLHLRQLEFEGKHTVKNNTFDYDGKAHTATIELSSPDIKIKYADADGNYTLDEIPSFTNAGTYVIHALLYIDNNHKSREIGFNVFINKVPIQLTSSNAYYIYTGEEHGINLDITSPGVVVKYRDQEGNYTLDEMPKYSEVGEYKIYYIINPGDNYYFFDSGHYSGVPAYKTLYIYDPDVLLNYYEDKEVVYNGDKHKIYLNTSINNLWLNIKYANNNGEYILDDLPQYTDAGEYEIKYSISDDSDYTIYGSSILTINKANINYYEYLDVFYTYDGLPHGINLKVTTPDVTVKFADGEGNYTLDEMPIFTDAGTYEVFVKLSKPNYNDVIISGKITIQKARIQYSSSSIKCNFDNLPHGINLTVDTPNITIKYRDADGNYTIDEMPTFTDVGTYEVYFKLINNNYREVESKQIVTISPLTIDYTVSDLEYIYDGNPHTIKLNVTTPDVTIKWDGKDDIPYYTDAGNHNISLTIAKDNYYTVSEHITLKIKPADIIYSVFDKEVTYDGNYYGLDLDVVTPGVTIKYMNSQGKYILDEAPTYKNAGSYVIKYYLYKDDNYNRVYGSNVLKINCKDILDAYTASDVTVTYDNKPHTIQFNNTAGQVLYANEDGDYVLYTIPKYTDAGEYIISYKIHFFDDNTNDIYGSNSLVINKAKINYTPSDKTYTYSGSAYGIQLSTSGTVRYADSDGNYTLNNMPTYTNVGEYDIKYKITNGSNYEEVYGSNKLTINKATIDYTSFDRTVTYDGEKHYPSLTINSKNIETKFADSEGNYVSEVEPSYTDAGEYNICFKLSNPNYYEVTKCNKLTINKKKLSASYGTYDYSYTYDGTPHTLTVKIEYSYPDGALIKYADSNGNYILDSAPTYINAGEYEIKFKIYLNDNYTDVLGSKKLTISKANFDKYYYDISDNYYTYDGKEHSYNVNIKTPGVKIKYGLESGKYIYDEIPTFINAGVYNIYFMLYIDDNYYEYTYYYPLTIFPADIDFIKSDRVYEYDNDEHGIDLIVNTPGITIKYADADGNYTLDEMPKYTDIGNYVISYELNGGDNYNKVTESNKLIIYDKSSQLIKRNYDYYKSFYLYDDGNLYYTDSDDYLKPYLSNIKDFTYKSSNLYYITDQGDLYSYYYFNPANILIDSNIKSILYYDSYYLNEFDAIFVLNNENDLVLYTKSRNSNQEYTKLTLGENIKKFYQKNNQYMFLTMDDSLYVYGINNYGEKFNDNLKITSPILLYEDVYKFTSDYVLLKNGDLIYFSSDVISAQIIDTDVTDIVNTDIYIKNNNIYFINSYISNKQYEVNIINIYNLEHNDNYQIVNDYNSNYILIGNKLYLFNNNNNRLLKDDVRQIFVEKFDYTENYYLHVITNDNKLYRYYDNEMYFITDGIDRYDMNTNTFVTLDNDNWIWGINNNPKLGIFTKEDNIDYPSKLVRNPNIDIKTKGIYIFEGTKKDITINDSLDILAIVLPYNSTNKNIIWSVSDQSIATIDKAGKLIALKEGKVTVYAKTEDGNYVDSFIINVHPLPQSIEIINNYNFNILEVTPQDKSHSIYLYVNVGNDDVINKNVQWLSSDGEIIRVSNVYNYNGTLSYERRYTGYVELYIGNKTGTVTITASTINGLNDTYTFNVVTIEPIEEIYTYENPYELKIDESVDIKTIYPKFNTDYYEITNTDFYNIKLNGTTIKGLSEGKSSISIAKKYLPSDGYNNRIYLYINVTNMLAPLLDNINGIIDKTNQRIYRLVSGLSYYNFINSIKNNSNVKIYDKNGEIVNSGIIKTGYNLRYVYGAQNYSYTLSIHGDVDGDGEIKSSDMLKVRQYLLNKIELNNEYFLASDINGDNVVNSGDLLRLRQHLLGTKLVTD